MNKIKIGIDARALFQKLTGIGYYTRNLISALSKIDKTDDFCLFGGHFWNNYQEKLKFYYPPESNNFMLYTRKLPHLLFPYESIIPVEIFTGRTDVFHGTNYVLPSIMNAQKVVTIHDMSFEIEPGWYPPEMKRTARLIHKSALKADMIIAISAATKNDIIKLYGISPDKITVIYYGSPSPLERTILEKKSEFIKNKYSLPDKFFLFVGILEPRKNIKGIMESFKITRRRGLKHKLVLAGHPGWKTAEVMETLEKLGLKNDVIFPGYIENNELQYIYFLADAFVFPSLNEGFGLPILEAMSSSTPVITSNISSTAEVAGDSALLVSPHDSEQIADAMYRFAADPDLRREYIEKGKKRLEAFSWEETARKTLELYRELCK